MLLTTCSLGLGELRAVRRNTSQTLATDCLRRLMRTRIGLLAQL